MTEGGIEGCSSDHFSCRLLAPTWNTQTDVQYRSDFADVTFNGRAIAQSVRIVSATKRSGACSRALLRTRLEILQASAAADASGKI
jgi:hypothetical protein